MTDRPWAITVSSRGKRDLKQIDRPVRQRIYGALKRLASDPTTHPQLRQLTGRPEARVRVGDWRVLVELDSAAREIRVSRVLPRGRAYDR